MKKQSTGLGVSLGVGVVVIGGLMALGLWLNKPVPKPTEGKLTLIHQSNRWGQLEPCGCHYNPNGGLDREANAVAQIRAEGKPVLYVDAGNIFLPEKKQRKGKIEHYRQKSEKLVEMLNEIGLEAAAPGPMDYELGVDALRGLSKQANFPFVSTNVSKKGSPIFRPYVVVKKDGVRYGLIGLSPKFKAPEGSHLEVQAPEKALKQWLPRVEKRSDVIVALSQMGPSENKKLAKQFPQIKIYIGASPTYENKHEVWIERGQAILVDVAIQGQQLGRLDVAFHFPVKGLYSEATIARNQSEVEIFEKSLKENKKQKKDTTYVKQYLDNLKAYASLNPIEGGSTYTAQSIKLDKERFGKENAISKKMATERERVRKRALAE